MNHLHPHGKRIILVHKVHKWKQEENRPTQYAPFSNYGQLLNLNLTFNSVRSEVTYELTHLRILLESLLEVHIVAWTWLLSFNFLWLILLIGFNFASWLFNISDLSRALVLSSYWVFIRYLLISKVFNLLLDHFLNILNRKIWVFLDTWSIWALLIWDDFKYLKILWNIYWFLSLENFDSILLSKVIRYF